MILFHFFFEKKNYSKHPKQTITRFDSVVAVTFQITFRAEIHVNDVFLFFKNYF
jgi:hypothetical protein